MIAGGLYAGIVGFMKVKFGSNEVIATMMLNTIAVNFVEYAVNYPLKEEGKSIAQTAKFAEAIWLPKIVEKTQLTIAVGCTGGKHRSVVFAQLLEEHMQEQKVRSTVTHRDIAKRKE